MKKAIGFVGVLGVLVLGAGASEATAIYVPGSYTTIQLAVNTANPGDTIKILFKEGFLR